MVRVIRQSGAPPLPWGEVLKRLPPVETATNATRPVLPAQPGTLPPAIADWAKNLSAAAPKRTKKPTFGAPCAQYPRLIARFGSLRDGIEDDPGSRTMASQSFHAMLKRAPQAYRGDVHRRRHWKGFQPIARAGACLRESLRVRVGSTPKSTEGRAMAARDAPEIEYRDLVNCNPDTDEDPAPRLPQAGTAQIQRQARALADHPRARPSSLSLTKTQARWRPSSQFTPRYLHALQQPQATRLAPPENRPVYLRRYKGAHGRLESIAINRRTYTQPGLCSHNPGSN